MKSEGLTSSRLAEILEMQPSGISHIVSGRNKPSFDLLQKILRRFPKINPDWLLLDSDQIYREQSRDALPLPSGENSNSSIDLFDLGAVSLGGESSPVSQKNGDQSSASTPGFAPQNMPENMPQNSPQNVSQFPPIFGAKNAQVERIIILYSDGTFSTYNGR
ncbi:MAG: helix-turn-helix transcriptional regulator [Rikenellaceae bacterium]